jgi:nucleotide-binding universal stress UspA family protein
VAPEGVTAMNESRDQLAAELVRVAEEREADALAVGASRQAGHRLLGSLATDLVRHASWPIGVVP